MISRKVYGEANPALTYTYPAGQWGYGSGARNELVSVTTATSSSNVGTYIPVIFNQSVQIAILMNQLGAASNWKSPRRSS